MGAENENFPRMCIFLKKIPRLFFLDNFNLIFGKITLHFMASPNSQLVSRPRKTDPQALGAPPQPKNPGQITAIG